MCTPVYCQTVVYPRAFLVTLLKNSLQKGPPPIFELRRAPARDTNLRRLPSSKHSAGERGLPTAPHILGVWVLTRFSGGTDAFGGRARWAMRGRDGITSQKTVRKPFEKAASVGVAALCALLNILGCTGYNTKTKKESPALFSASNPKKVREDERQSSEGETPEIPIFGFGRGA